MGCQRPGRPFAFILKPEDIQVIPTDQNLNETEVTDKLDASGARLSRFVLSSPKWLLRASLSLLHGAPTPTWLHLSCA